MLNDPARFHKKWHPEAESGDWVMAPIIHMTGFLRDGRRVLVLDGTQRPFMLTDYLKKPKRGTKERESWNKSMNRKYRLPNRIFDIDNSPIKIKKVTKKFKRRMGYLY